MSPDTAPQGVASASDDIGRNTRLVRRQRVALVVTIGCAVLAVAGLIASRFVESPRQAAADIGPPTPSVLTVHVDKRVLKQTVITRGTVSPARRITVDVTSAPKGRRPVVTAVPVKAGQQVKPGQVLVEVSGRPVIVLPGAIPAYRDLVPGTHGKDVIQLQLALAKLGDYRGQPSGTVDSVTQQAIAALYQAAGYTVPTAGGTRGTSERTKDAPHNGAAKAHDAGSELPVSEVVFVPHFPARVSAVSTHVGAKPGKALLTLATGALRVTANLPPHRANLLKRGSQVQITSEMLGKTTTGTLSAIDSVTTHTARSDVSGDGAGRGTTTQSGGSSSPTHVPATITPSKSLPAVWAGQDVRLTFSRARTQDPVLVIPISAISTGADGATTVTVYQPNSDAAKRRRVSVRTGVTANGYVQVTPSEQDALRKGDMVVVGRK